MLRTMLQIIQRTVKMLVLVSATVHGVTLQIKKGMFIEIMICGCILHVCTHIMLSQLCQHILTSCAHIILYPSSFSCMSSPTQRAYRSSYFTFERDGIDLYWSYTVCDGLDDWENSNVKQTLGGVTIVATTPQAYFPPYHYKRNVNTGEILSEPGEEYWNTSIPFEGAMIDYLDQLQQLADGDFDVQYTFGSKASKLVHPSSSYTAIVQDVKDGLIDMAVGPIWITGERLRISSYTVPLFYSPTVLITSKPGVDSSLGAQTSKVLAPFEAGVWLLIVLIIALTAILSMWFSGEGPERLKIARRQSRSVVRSMARNIPEGPSMKKMKYKIWARYVQKLYMLLYWSNAF